MASITTATILAATALGGAQIYQAHQSRKLAEKEMSRQDANQRKLEKDLKERTQREKETAAQKLMRARLKSGQGSGYSAGITTDSSSGPKTAIGVDAARKTTLGA